MDRSIRALVAVEGLDVFDVQRALPDDPSFELIGVADGVDETVRVLQEKDVDVVLVACQGREDDRSLQIIDGAHRTAPETPIVVLSTSSPNGFLRRAFEAGAADMALFPQSKEQLRFAMSKAITRAPRRGAAQGGRAARRASRLRARPEGRHGQDPHLVQPRGRARARRAEGPRHRPRPAVRRRRALHGPASREDDVRPRGLGRLPRRGQAPRLRDDCTTRGSRSCSRRPGPIRRARSPSSCSETSSSWRAARTTSSSPTRRRASRPRSSPPSTRAPTS